MDDKELPKTEVAEIAINKGSWKPVAATFEDQQRLVSMYVKSGVLPKRFENVAQAMTALHFASEHFPGMEMTALRNIAVIDGNPCLFGDLPLAMVQRHPEFALIDETLVGLGENGMVVDTTQAVCKVVRAKESGNLEITRGFSVADAKLAQLWARGTYQKYPKRMLQMRARSWALKDSFADVLMGIGIVEYDSNKDPNERDVSSEKIEGLNKIMNLPERPREASEAGLVVNASGSCLP